MQDDKVQPLLTVQEAMQFAANLKLGPEFSSKHKMERVNSFIFTSQYPLHVYNNIFTLFIMLIVVILCCGSRARGGDYT
jgi:hypothetical protein